MSARILTSALAGLVLVASATFVGCAPEQATGGSTSATGGSTSGTDGSASTTHDSASAADGSASATDGSTSATDDQTSATVPPSATDGGPRFLIECVGLDGSVIGPFTGLEEAWASTNYVRIDHCAASSGTGQPLELTAEEESIASTGAADVPDEDLVDLYLWTLATCVRVAPDSVEGLSTLPTSLLRATLELCPEAPHAGLVENELEARSQ